MFYGFRAFTLIELLIAITIASFIFLSTASTFFLLTKSLENLNNREEYMKLYELFLVLQRGTYPSKGLTIKKNHSGTQLEFLTNYSFTKIFVKVQIIFTNKSIIYRELIPGGEKVLLEIELKETCKLNQENSHLILICGENTFLFPLTRQTFTHFFGS